jgi:dTDP-4-amino-4,6-dideoxygalactose transaminase
MISVFGCSVGEEEKVIVNKAIDSQWLGLGSQVDKFENEIKKKFSIKNFLMVDSGSNALYMAIKLLDLPLGSEIILPSFTWVSCAQAVLLAGCKPVFCDVDLVTMNVTKKLIQKKITNNTKAIMIVHYAGLPVNMDKVKELGFPVIEDAAHAIYSKYKGLQCGAIGDIGIYSFDSVKNLTCAEGGGLVTRDKHKIKRAKTLRYCGIGKSGFQNLSEGRNNKRWWEYEISEPFIKMLPNNISASIGLGQLKKIDLLQSIRADIWKVYNENLSGIKEVITPIDVSEKDSRHSYFTYCIRAKNRDYLARFLLDNKIYTTLRYHPLHMNTLYKQKNIELINSEILNQEALSLPIHPRLVKADILKICSLIRKFYKN